MFISERHFISSELQRSNCLKTDSRKFTKAPANAQHSYRLQFTYSQPNDIRNVKYHTSYSCYASKRCFFCCQVWSFLVNNIWYKNNQFHIPSSALNQQAKTGLNYDNSSLPVTAFSTWFIKEVSPSQNPLSIHLMKAGTVGSNS